MASITSGGVSYGELTRRRNTNVAEEETLSVIIYFFANSFDMLRGMYSWSAWYEKNVEVVVLYFAASKDVKNARNVTLRGIYFSEISTNYT